MKIGVLSDTHSKVALAKRSLDALLENGAEFIVHAGDVCELETLELLKNCGKRYIVVYGNNDAHLLERHDDYELVQEPHYFKLADTEFKLMHLPFYMAPDVEVVISGHTHDFNSEFLNGTLFLNPGESCARDKPVSECAMLEITDEEFVVTYFSRQKKEESFQTETFSYKRTKR
jgi:uncharacterized protein